MIADKVIPSFYFLELTGDAVKCLHLDDFNIAEVVIESNNFNSDLYATSELKNSLHKIASDPLVGVEKIEIEGEFNPEFFPSLNKKQLTENELDELYGGDYDPNKVSLTCDFDKYGDFVQSRFKVKSDRLNMVGRVAVDPDKYIEQKVAERLAEKSLELITQKITSYH